MTNKLALVVAVVLGVFSIIGIRFYLEKIKTQFETSAQLVDVLVATSDLKAGDTLAENSLGKKSFPKAVLDGLGSPPTHYLAEESTKILNQRVVVPRISSGQILQQYHFRTSGAVKRLSPGNDFRAITIPVTPLNALSNMLRVGDLVDVAVTVEFSLPGGLAIPGAKDKLKFTYTLLKRVKILALDSVMDPDALVYDYTTITLQLKPGDANRLLHTIDHGAPFHLLKLDELAPDSPTAPDVAFGDKIFREGLEAELKRHLEGPR